MQRILLGKIGVDFERNRSTTDHTVYIRQILEKKWEHNQALSISFKKAYGSVRREDLYNILIQFGIPMKLVRIIKMCLNEKCSRMRVGRNLSDMFTIRNCLKQGDAITPLLFNFALEYAIWRVQVNRDGLKLNGTHQLVVDADGVNILGGGERSVKENAAVVTSKEIGLEVNADTTKKMTMSLDQITGRSHNMKNDNYKYLL